MQPPVFFWRDFFTLLRQRGAPVLLPVGHAQFMCQRGLATAGTDSALAPVRILAQLRFLFISDP